MLSGGCKGKPRRLFLLYLCAVKFLSPLEGFPGGCQKALLPPPNPCWQHISFSRAWKSHCALYKLIRTLSFLVAPSEPCSPGYSPLVPRLIHGSGRVPRNPCSGSALHRRPSPVVTILTCLLQ